MTSSSSNADIDVIFDDDKRRTFASLNLHTLSLGHSRVFAVAGNQRLSVACANSKGKPKYVVRFGCHSFCVSDVVKGERGCCVAMRSIEPFSYCEKLNMIDGDPLIFSDVDGRPLMRVSELFARLFENPPGVMKGG